jgi:hypothetical protein
MTTPAPAACACLTSAQVEAVLGRRSGRRQDDARSDRQGAAANAIVEADEIAKRRRQRVIRIAITAAAFEAIARTLPLGSVGYENKTDEQGNRLIWLDRAVVDRLRAMRGPGESYSDVILRIAAEKIGGDS